MIVGIDLSLNHGAATLLDGKGNFVDCAYFTQNAGSAKQAEPPVATRLRVQDKKREENQQYKMWRLCWVRTWLETIVLDRWKPKYVGIEDYALRVENGAHQMGEIGGIARMLCWDRGVHFRLHDPISVKMFATHDGTAQKDLVERKVKEKWGLDFSKYNGPPPKKGTASRCTSEDLADAVAIAKLVRMEIQLRSGKLAMSVLHAKEVQVFNRITNSYPTNLLGREFIVNKDGGYITDDVLKNRRLLSEKHRKLLGF